VTFSRDIPKDATDWDVGFHFTGLYGFGRALNTPCLGIAEYALDRALPARRRGGPVRRLHVPVLVGLDVKAGCTRRRWGSRPSTPRPTRLFALVHLQLGHPLKHSGVLAVLHATDTLDLYGAVDTGVNTTFGDQKGDNNGSMGGLFRLRLHAASAANLTGVALTHLGPENPARGNTQPLGLYNANHTTATRTTPT